MSNQSYLIACDERTPAPTLTLKSRQYQLLAEGTCRVPPLWMALFREADLLDRKSPMDGQSEQTPQSPVVARRRVASRLREARQQITKVHSVDPNILGGLLDALQTCIDAIPPRRKYLVCEWQEIAGLNLRQHQREMDWLFRFYSGATVRAIDKKLAELCGGTLSKRFQDPLTTSSSDYTEHSWRVLDGLLGDTPSANAPWHPQKAASAAYPNLFSAVHAEDADALKQMLTTGTKIQPGDVQFAAQQDDPGLLKLLLQFGGDPNEMARKGRRRDPVPLIKAFNSFSKPSQINAKIRLLLDHGADPSLSGLESYSVLVCCYRHGIKFADEILRKANKKVVREFLQFAESEHGQAYARECSIRWKGPFLKAAQARLKH